MENLLSRFKEELIQAKAALTLEIFPMACVGCHVTDLSVENHLCHLCQTRLFEKTTQTHWRKRLGMTNTHSDVEVYSLANYDTLFRQVIHSFKFKKKRRLARPLGNLFAQADRLIPGFNWQDFSGLLTVPTAGFMFLNRHYDHMDLLYHEIRKKLMGRNCCPQPLRGFVENISSSKAQVSLNRKNRIRNAQRSFVLKNSMSHLPKDARILIIDDILTTGATLSSLCQLILQDQPHLRLTALTLLRVPEPVNFL